MGPSADVVEEERIESEVGPLHDSDAESHHSPETGVIQGTDHYWSYLCFKFLADFDHLQNVIPADTVTINDEGKIILLKLCIRHF